MTSGQVALGEQGPEVVMLDLLTHPARILDFDSNASQSALKRTHPPGPLRPISD
ncbi:MAG TPA: hypothetical protein VMO88_00280 [Acidimicrobiales bacterium]|nr:hypothetical protein [Acidimicrobiales bacterium]